MDPPSTAEHVESIQGEGQEVATSELAPEDGESPRKRARTDDGEDKVDANAKKGKGTEGVQDAGVVVQNSEGTVVRSTATEFLERGDRCDATEEEIASTEVHIKSAINPSIDICVPAFAEGKEFTSEEGIVHRASDPYHVMEPLDFPLLCDDWTAEDELSMLAALREDRGGENWEKVAEYVGKPSTVCRQHYAQYYLQGPTAPLPDTSAVPSSMAEARERQAARENKEAAGGDEAPFGGRSKAGRKAGKSVSGYHGRPQAGEGLRIRGTALPAGFREVDGAAEEVGYNALRGTFETEWDDEAEQVIADLVFKDSETPEEHALKLKMIEIYNSKLDERQARKAFIIDRGLLDTKRVQAFDRRRTKAEKELAHQMKPFARFHSQEQHEQFVNCVAEELRIRNLLLQLCEYKRLGIRTHAEAEKYEVEKKKRAAEVLSRKQRQKAASLYSTGKATSRRHSTATTAVGDTSGAALVGAEGFHALTEVEQGLCASIRISPLEFLIIKCALEMAGEPDGLSKEDAIEGVKLEGHKVERIYEVMVAQGTIKARETRRRHSGFLSALSSPL